MPYTLHCILTGHDVCMADVADRCVHCGIKLPAGSIRLAGEALMRGFAVILVVLCFAAARHGVESVRAGTSPLPELESHEDQAAQDR